MKTPLQSKVNNIFFYIMRVTHQLAAKITSYHGLPRVTSKIEKI